VKNDEPMATMAISKLECKISRYRGLEYRPQPAHGRLGTLGHYSCRHHATPFEADVPTRLWHGGYGQHRDRGHRPKGQE
jgi:hypothetical protein